MLLRASPVAAAMIARTMIVLIYISFLSDSYFINFIESCHPFHFLIHLIPFWKIIPCIFEQNPTYEKCLVKALISALCRKIVSFFENIVQKYKK